MGDTNGNDHADHITLTYSEPINHVDDKDGTFPFAVSGYTIREVKAATASKKLVILILELPNTGIEARPQIIYFQTPDQPVVDLAGNQAKAQTFKRTKPLDLDGDGYTVADGDCAPKDPTIHPGALDKPDLGFVDSNCDGIDGDPSKAIFVSPSGNDANPGTKDLPKQTVQAGIDAAAAAVPPLDVYIAAGSYTRGGRAGHERGAVRRLRPDDVGQTRIRPDHHLRGPSIGIFHGGSSTVTGSGYATITIGSGGAGGAAPNPGQNGIAAAICP